jgi:hypothetical protein
VGSFSPRSIGSLKRSASERLDASEQGVTKLELAAQRGAQHHGELVEFESEAFVGFVHQWLKPWEENRFIRSFLRFLCFFCGQSERRFLGY